MKVFTSISKLSVFIAFVFLLSSCGGFVKINRIEGFSTKLENVPKVMYIAPQAFVYNNSSEGNSNGAKTERLQKVIDKELESLSKVKKNKIELIKLNSGQKGLKEDYLRYLIPLKNELLMHAQLQENPLNSASQGQRNFLSKQVFVVPIKINPEWSKLSLLYNTPYFGSLALISKGKQTILINYVVDVNKAEVIYQSISYSPLKLGNPSLSHLVFDSIQLMVNKN
jgi:hypothetical protein